MSDVSQWSTTAASNNAAPPDGWPESTLTFANINNCAREMMAALAKWYSDMDGTLTSGGAANAYTLTTNSTHAALADMPLVVFKANHACTGASTLAVDGLTAKGIKKNHDQALASGDIEANQICVCVYNVTDDTYELISHVGNVPITEILSDTTPQLGGNLDVNDFDITNASGDVAVLPVTTGALVVKGNSTQAGRIRLNEDTDNGTNYMGFSSPAAVTASLDLILPDGDGSANQVMQTDGSGTLSWVTRAQLATGTYTGDGSTSKAITGLAFQPKFVFIWSGGADAASAAHGWTSDLMVDDDPQGLMVLVSAAGAGDLQDNRILSLDATGFTVSDNGADQFPNANTVVYYYLALG